MALNGIDISNWQKGINLVAVPADFVICKATEGTSYVSPDCARQVEQAAAAGKLVGTYHYITGIGAVAEADYYLNNISNWIGKYMLCLDWESGGNRAWGNESYLEQMVQRVIQRTGIPPMIYVQQSRMSAVKPVAQRNNCGLWIAQYANMNTTGYQSTPWNEGAYSCAMRQYSSRGRLNGYGGDLDLNKFYGDRSAWLAYCNPSGAHEDTGSSSSGGSTAGNSGAQGMRNAQIHINNFTSAGIPVDGLNGPKTRKGFAMSLQVALNHDYGADLKVDGIIGIKTNTVRGSHWVKRGETQYMVTFVEIGLTALGYYGGAVESPGIFGYGLENAVEKFQRDTGLRVDRIAGRDTMDMILRNMGCI